MEWDVELYVARTVEAFLLSHRQRDDENERGGQLFVDLRNERGLCVTLATPPHRRDRRGRQWLELDRKRCAQELKQASLNNLRLVGYWHTHPESIPQISPQDVQSFRAFSRVNAPSMLYPVCVIVGREGMRAWSIRENAVVEAERNGIISTRDE